MNTSNLRINQLADADYQWYLNYLAAIDDRDIARYAEFLAPSCSMHFNNVLMAPDKQAMVAALSGYWQSYASLEHELLNIYGSGDAFMLEALNHYQRHDGQQVSLRAVALTDRNQQGLVTSVRVYSDTSTLFA